MIGSIDSMPVKESSDFGINHLENKVFVLGVWGLGVRIS